MKKGKILTVGELKALPAGSYIHLWYKDDDNVIRTNSFKKFHGYEGEDELCTSDFYTMPIDGLDDSDLLEKIDNSGWIFTVSEAIV